MTTYRNNIIFLIRQVLVRGYYASEILYYFLSILSSLNEKTQNYKVVDLIESYNFYINFIFIRRRIEELWFFKSSVLSRHSRWRDITVLSRQWKWRDKVFHIGNIIQRGTSCRVNTCGAIALFVTPAPLARPKGLDLNFLDWLLLKY